MAFVLRVTLLPGPLREPSRQRLVCPRLATHLHRRVRYCALHELQVARFSSGCMTDERRYAPTGVLANSSVASMTFSPSIIPVHSFELA